MSEALAAVSALQRKLAAAAESARPLLAASGPVPRTRVCVGMATYDEYDAAWFTVQALATYHSGVPGGLSIVLIDNHPEGLEATPLKALEDSVPGYRYVPFRGFRSTAVKDLIVAEADADIVVIIDAHVLLAPGTLDAVVAYFDAHPDSLDLLHGPLLADHSTGATFTHYEPVWSQGFYGRWTWGPTTSEMPRSPFPIEMSGTGFVACRASAWPGLNPRFRGYGGEEGYLQEKIRQLGGRVLCLPEAVWMHRPSRPAGTPYAVSWHERVRNYLLGWTEIGWSADSVRDHFQEALAGGHLDVSAMLTQIDRELSHPLIGIDAVLCPSIDPTVWQASQALWGQRDLAWRVERIEASPTPEAARLPMSAFAAVLQNAVKRRLPHAVILREGASLPTDHELAHAAQTVLSKQERIVGLTVDGVIAGLVISASSFTGALARLDAAHDGDDPFRIVLASP